MLRLFMFAMHLALTNSPFQLPSHFRSLHAFNINIIIEGKHRSRSCTCWTFRKRYSQIFSHQMVSEGVRCETICEMWRKKYIFLHFHVIVDCIMKCVRSVSNFFSLKNFQAKKCSQMS